MSVRHPESAPSASSEYAGASPESLPFLDKLVGYAITYFQDFVKPNKRFRAPTPEEAEALAEEGIEFGRMPWLPRGN